MRQELPKLLVISEKSAPHPETLIGWPVCRLGFRPFYLSAAVFACISLVLWVSILHGVMPLPLDMPPALWHAHEMLFGFAVAVIVGFLFTAVKAWTGLPTPRGWQLAALVAVWALARVAPWTGSYEIYATLDMALLPIAAAVLLRLLIRAGNQRNMPLISLLVLMALTNATFHLAVMGVVHISAHGVLHGQLALILMVIIIMAGRVIPMFTQNVTPGLVIQPTPRLEKALLIVTIVALLSWVLEAPNSLTGISATLAFALHARRLWQWQPRVTRNRPILWVLHASYAWVPFGFVLLAFSKWGWLAESLAIHAFAVGAVGGLIMGMITRTARGHTGRMLETSRAEIVAYACVMLAASVRVFMPWVAPALYVQAIEVSALLWVLAFGLYVWVYGPWLMQTRLDGKDG